MNGAANLVAVQPRLHNLSLCKGGMSFTEQENRWKSNDCIRETHGRSDLPKGFEAMIQQRAHADRTEAQAEEVADQEIERDDLPTQFWRCNRDECGRGDAESLPRST